MEWFDGHLDLTYLALHGRDMSKPVEACGGTLLPATVTFPSLRAAGVRRVVSTLFVRKRTAAVSGSFCFETAEEAFAGAMQQVAMHDAWRRAREFDGMQVTLAIEGAACVRNVEDLQRFYAAGVRMVALAWGEGSVWAGGDQSGGDLTEEGKVLVREMDRLGIIHDVSHLSERAFWSLLEVAEGPVVASHSNCRALLPGAKGRERHLSDEQIRALAERAGARIGVNAFARFILPPEELARRRATVGDLVRHVEHIAEVAGRREIVALGSDFDSGFTPERLPVDLQGPGDLVRLAEALFAAGWGDDEIAQFATGWDSLLPEMRVI